MKQPNVNEVAVANSWKLKAMTVNLHQRHVDLIAHALWGYVDECEAQALRGDDSRDHDLDLLREAIIAIAGAWARTT